MDFTERLDLYKEGGMLTDDDVKDVEAIIKMFKDDYGVELQEENADTFIAHICAAYSRNKSGEPVDELPEAVRSDMSEIYKEKYLHKAEVLIEALPYIQQFNRKVIVVKYGGSAMADDELKRNVIKDVTLLKLVGFKPIVVHGGGKEISAWISKVGKEPKFVNGLRVTDAETMEIAEMVLEKVNKSLVTMVNELGVKAVGISGKDGGLLKVEKKYSNGEDIGFVGGYMKRINKNQKKGFTLLEIVLVIAMLCILLGAVFYGLKDSLTRSEEASNALVSEQEAVAATLNAQEAEMAGLGF